MRKEYKQMMDQLSPREELVEQVLAQAGAHAEQKQNRRRPMHKKKLILALAAALVVLTGSAMAVGSQLGLLNVFFQGDTSGLEPYVQTDLGSAENEDFRFTVNSAYYDGMTVYATVTVEGLNEQAVEDLKSNKVIAECHREVWGQEMVDGLMKSGSTGPDAIMCNMHAIIMDDGHECSGTGIGGAELPAPSDTSRSWRVNVSFEQWMGPLNTPLKIWAGFMGEAYAVEIPLDTTAGSVHLESNQEFLLNNLTGARAVLREVTLTPTQLYYEYQSIGEDVPDTADMSASDASKYWFILKMKDGSLLTASQIGFNGGSGGTSDSNTGIHSFHFKFKSVKFSEVSEVESIILGDMEFPLDGAKPFPAEIDEVLSSLPLLEKKAVKCAVGAERLAKRHVRIKQVLVPLLRFGRPLENNGIAVQVSLGVVVHYPVREAEHPLRKQFAGAGYVVRSCHEGGSQVLNSIEMPDARRASAVRSVHAVDACPQEA